MAKIQSRRSISINRDLYDRALERSVEIGISLAKMTEEALWDHLRKLSLCKIAPVSVTVLDIKPSDPAAIEAEIGGLVGVFPRDQGNDLPPPAVRAEIDAARESIDTDQDVDHVRVVYDED